MKKKSKLSPYKSQIIKNIVQKFPWDKVCHIISEVKKIHPSHEELTFCDGSDDCLKLLATQMLTDLAIQYEESIHAFSEAGSMYSNCLLAQIDERGNLSLSVVPYLLYEFDIVAENKNLN
jgi:hypothetical protein